MPKSGGGGRSLSFANTVPTALLQIPKGSRGVLLQKRINHKYIRAKGVIFDVNSTELLTK
jgi:hypothetical protein